MYHSRNGNEVAVVVVLGMVMVIVAVVKILVIRVSHFKNCVCVKSCVCVSKVVCERLSVTKLCAERLCV